MREKLAFQIEELERMIEAGDLSGALDFLEAMSQEERSAWQIQNLTGVVCAYCGQFREAENFFTAALAQNPDDENILYNLADTREALKKSEQLREEPKEQAVKVCRRVLMAAYYFPPLSGSGVFRSIKFAKYLRRFGWEPTVISTDKPPDGWNFADKSQVAEIPGGMEVVRVPDGISTGRETTLDEKRVRAVLEFLRDVLRFSPEADRMFVRLTQDLEGIKQLITFPCGALCWAYDAVQYIEKNMDPKQFQVVYTTSGPSSAHLIGFYLKQKYGIRWVADYRDPWTFNPYGADYDPSNVRQRLLFELESVLLHGADRNITVEESLIPSYEQHFGLEPGRVVSITNGYDEEDFAALQVPEGRTDKFTINYSGLLYTQQRSIAPVLTALRQLEQEKKIRLERIQFRIVGLSEAGNISAAKEFGLDSILVQTGYVSHAEALKFNLEANLLLLLVGDEPKFKPVYTGKFFEYLRSGRPILALAPKGGAVARTLKETGHGEAFLSTQVGQIKAMILREYKKWERGEGLELLHSQAIERFERRELTRQLAEVLAQVSYDRAPLSEPGRGEPVHRAPKYLVICNGGYPTEGNPRCMFAHQRVLQYIKAGLNVEAFGFIWGSPFAQYEYQGIKVTQGGVPELQNLLQNEEYEKLLIHFVDNGIMYAIQQAGKLKMPMVIWCHGYEVLRWHRTYYCYSPRQIAENEQALEENDQEKFKMLRQIFTFKNIQFIFVSNWLINRVKSAVGSLPIHYEIVPNYIDCNLYKTNPKTASDRMRILCIKSHSTKTYANDITAKAILRLSKTAFFSNLTFELYGDGVLFEENFKELIQFNFPNVHIHRKYLSHNEMSALFKSNGILMAPTRMDSQGVTACEAMSAGLVVISCNTAAIPEFMDEDCASLYEFDNYFQLADEIEYLYYHPDEFLRKSQNAVRRVREQCGYEATIAKEIGLIEKGSLPDAGSESPVNRTLTSFPSIRDNDSIIRTLPARHRDPNESFSSKDYWETRYARGGTSGSGSYNRLAQFKAEIINDFIQKHQITSMIEWGCGDGNQLGLFLPIDYVGYDVSKTAVEICRKKYPNTNKVFVSYDGTKQSVEKRELALSLDVIYHLVEDDVFENYMYNLFNSSTRYICIYSNNYDLDMGAHQKNRSFTGYVGEKFPEWTQISMIKNRYPFDPKDPDNTSLADFYIYEHI